jgi:hypothetical protein
MELDETNDTLNYTYQRRHIIEQDPNRTLSSRKSVQLQTG